MKVAIMQPYFLPYIGYWQLMNMVDVFVIYDDVNYIKKGWINRNKILVNGKANLINLQIAGASQNKLINETFVHSDKTKRNDLLKTIEYSYKNAPYFNRCFPIIKDILLNEEKKLHLYLENQIKLISAYIGIQTTIIRSSELKKKEELKGEDKIIEICKILNAKEYINPIGGIDLYDKKSFANENLDLKFLEQEALEYNQFGDDFIPNLSIVDALMFNSTIDLRRMLLYYKLI